MPGKKGFECGFSILAHNMGDKVMATMPDTMTAPASVTPVQPASLHEWRLWSTTSERPNTPSGCEADRGSGRVSPPSSENPYRVPARAPASDTSHQPRSSGVIARLRPSAISSTRCRPGAQTLNLCISLDRPRGPQRGTYRAARPSESGRLRRVGRR